MTTSSPALHTASRVEIIASVEPQHTVISFSGSTVIPCHTPICRAIALRRFFAPQVMAYWFTSAATASCAACLISAGAGKSGNPCARLTAPCSIACRVISRMTDSVKCPTLSLRKCFPGAERSAPASAARRGWFGEVFLEGVLRETPAGDFLDAVFLVFVEERAAIGGRL